MNAADFHARADELRDRILATGSEAWSDEEFARRAHEAFQLQYEASAPYRTLCARRGVEPGTVASWEEIPAVPATAFKVFDFDVSPGGTAAALFRTSGTTRGRERRGRHHVPRPDLYRASLLEPFRRALLPDVATLPFVSLIPAPQQAPDSSLSFMVGAAAETFASEAVWLVGPDGAWRPDAVQRASELAARGEPVLVLGTALAFVHALRDEPAALPRLPQGSRIMETGGFKGVDREISRSELYASMANRSGVGRDRIVNEYGMTELLSQLYEPVLSEGPESAGWHVPPPWLRVRALDPESLEPLGEGRDGLLAFFDLANLGSICHVLTEDVGRVVDGRVRLEGRVAGSEPRGCSRAMDEMMSAAL